MTAFNDPALLAGLQKALNNNLDGLTEPELRRYLIEQDGLRRNPSEIRKALEHHHPKIFVSFASGKWRLRTSLESDEIATGQRQEERERGEPEIPYLAKLPALDQVIVFDLETTGLHPDKDRIIQIAAVRLINGESTSLPGPKGTTIPAVFNEYVNHDNLEIPYALKVKLGFTRHKDWFDRLKIASSLPDVLEMFRLWVGDLPLVAHNGRGLDFPFLEQAGFSPSVRLDTMELALLACPESRSLNLAELSRHLGICDGQQGGEQVSAWADQLGITDFAWDNLHNAVVDVLITAATFCALQNTLQSRLLSNPILAIEFSRLWPHLLNRLNIPFITPVAEVNVQNLFGLINPNELPDSNEAISGSNFNPSQIKEVFSQLSKTPGKKERLSQLKMVEEVGVALAENRFRLIEAPTGTGKSLAYLVPSLLWALSQGDPVVISTQTRVLQDQLAGDLEWLRHHFQFRSQILKGMSNYICLDRLVLQYSQLDHSKLDDEERFVWLVLLSWLSATKEGWPDEINYWAKDKFPLLPRLIESLEAEREECSPDDCANCGFCFHQNAWQKAADADLIVINHSLLLAKDWTQGQVQFQRAMIDEAHNLEEAATQASTEEVSLENISYLSHRLHDPKLGQGLLIRLRDKVRVQEGQKLISVIRDQNRLVSKQSKDFGERLKRYCELNQTTFDPNYGSTIMLEADPNRANPVSWAPVELVRNDLVQTLTEVGRTLGRLEIWLNRNPLPAFQRQTLNEIHYLADRFQEISNLLNAILKVGYDRLVIVHWVEVKPPFKSTRNDETIYPWAVKRAPVRIGPYLERVLYSHLQSLVLTSATLSTTREQGFEFILDRLGLLERVGSDDLICLDPELDYSRALFAVTRYMRYDARPNEVDNFVDELGQEIATFFKFTGGNGLGLFTARKRMVKVYQAIEPALSPDLIGVACQGETGNGRAVLEELKTQPGSVALGLKSFWEGIDVKGPNLSYVLMEKLPFPMLGEPITKARIAELRDQKRMEFGEYILPLMLITFKQGFGRLLRDEADIGAVLLLDKRVWTREYWPDLKAALPGAGSKKQPVIVEDERLLSRRGLYSAILEHLENAPVEWELDLNRLRNILPNLPEAFLTHLEWRLEKLSLPLSLTIEALSSIWQQVIQALQQLFKFNEFKSPEQEVAIKAMLTGQDTLVVLPTGSGKSLSFQLPALLRDGTTIVFSPLKALMKDQVDKLLSIGLTVADRIDSTMSAEEQERVYQRMREGQTRLVYIAPERVRDPKLIAALRAAHRIIQVVVDEAHCVHVWGQSFRPDFLYINRLVEAITSVNGQRPPLAALTATATPAVQEAIIEKLGLRPDYVSIIANPNRPELRFIVYNRYSGITRVESKRDKLRILLRILRAADRRNETALVYVSTTREAERLARQIERIGLDVRYYHGQMDDQQRKDVQDLFLEGQVKIIVATKAFGMGIDKSDIRYVIHYQIPADLESYYQEAGRAGRGGETSYCILFYHSSDVWIHQNYFIPNSLPDRTTLQTVLNWLLAGFDSLNEPVLYVDPRKMREDLGFEEERQLGLYLHLIENEGFIKREVDVTLSSRIRLLSSLETVIKQAELLSSKKLAGTILENLEVLGVSKLKRTDLPLLEIAQKTGIDPLVLDDIFYQLALDGHIIYRAIERGYTVIRQPHFQQGVNAKIDLTKLNHVQTEMVANLEIMKRYASGLRAGDCLRKEALTYFHADKPATPRSSCCNLCDPNLSVPWADEPVWEDLSDPARYNDARFEILKSVAWNVEQAKRGRSPYGNWKLANILAGEEYQLLKYEKDPQLRSTRRGTLTTGSYFGTLEGLDGGVKTILNLMAVLKQSGHLHETIHQWSGGNYLYLSLSDIGQQRLREGKFFSD